MDFGPHGQCEQEERLWQEKPISVFTGREPETQGEAVVSCT